MFIYKYVYVYVHIYIYMYVIERPSADTAVPNPEHVTPSRPIPMQVTSGLPETNHVINQLSRHTLSRQFACLDRSWRVPGVSLGSLQGCWGCSRNVLGVPGESLGVATGVLGGPSVPWGFLGGTPGVSRVPW